MTTRLRAGPRSTAAIFAFTAILAASAALLAATPVQAAAATTLKFQQYNEAPVAITLQATTVATADLGLVPEVASSPTVAWTNVTDATAAAANVVFGTNYFAADLPARAAPINSAVANMVTNSFGFVENARAPAINQAATDAKKNLVLGAARAAPLATANNVSFTYSADGISVNDFKMDLAIGTARAAPATLDAKKATTSYGA